MGRIISPQADARLPNWLWMMSYECNGSACGHASHRKTETGTVSNDGMNAPDAMPGAISGSAARRKVHMFVAPRLDE